MAPGKAAPPSLLLFALAMEPLLTGISCSGVELKLSLYTDDLVLYVSNPRNSVPAILSILQQFGSFSDYKVSVSKSECFPMNSKALS